MMKSRIAVLLALWCWGTAGSELRSQPRPTTLPLDTQLERLNLDVDWRINLPLIARDDTISVMQVVGNDLFIQMKAGRLLCLDLLSGRERWRFSFENRYLGQKLVAASVDTVFVLDGILLHALERATGKAIFRQTLGSTAAAEPVADIANVYVPLSNQTISIYNYRQLATATPLPPPEKELPLAQGVSLSPQSVETLVSKSHPSPSINLLGSLRPPFEMARPDSHFSIQTLPSLKPPYGLPKENEAPSITALPRLADLGDQTDKFIRANTPTKVLDLQINHRMIFPPLITPRLLFTPTVDQVAVATSRQFSIFFYDFDPLASISAPLGQHEKLAYIPTSDSSLFAIDTEFNDMKWRFTAGGILDQKPVVTPDFVYAIGSRSGISKVKRESGSLLWENRSAREILAINQKYIYARDPDMRLLVLDQTTGRTLTALPLPEKVITYANDENDRILLALPSGLLMCISDRDLPTPLIVDPKRYPSFGPPKAKAVKKEEPMEEMKEEPKKEEPKAEEPKKEEAKADQ